MKILVTFILNKRVSYKPTRVVGIICQIRYDLNGVSKSIKFATGYKCAISKFRDQRVHASSPNADEINRGLERISKRAKDVYFMGIDIGEIPNPVDFKRAIFSDRKMVVEESRDINVDFGLFVEYHTNKGTTYSVLRQISRSFRIAKETFELHGTDIGYKSFDLVFYERFKAYMRSKKYNYSVNTIGLNVSKIKGFLTFATANGWNKYAYYDHPLFKRVSEESDTDALTQPEIDMILNADLSKCKPSTLWKHRDMFLLACEIGVRYSDYKKIGRENIEEVDGGYDFVFVQHKNRKKTTASVRIPLSNEAMRILIRHDFNLHVITNQKSNDYIKIIYEAAGIKKHVTTHTARRTFATLRYYEGILPMSLIMTMTGHKTERNFFKYIRMREDKTHLIRDRDSRYVVNRPGLLNDKSKLKIV